MIKQWTDQELFLNVAKVFRIAILLWLLLHTLLLLPFHATIWGPTAYVMRLKFHPSWFDWIFSLALHPEVQPYYLLFVSAQIACATFGILGIWIRPMLIASYILMVNLSSLSGVILDGGNNLSQLLVFFLIGVNSSGQPVKDSRLAPWLRTLSNTAFLMCQLQVSIVYLSAGLLKLNGHLWQNGMALYYIFQSENFGLPLIGRILRKFPELSLLGTYGTLAFQYLFPVLIWMKRFRLPLIGVGVCIHMGIAFGMGLFTFGLVMCLAYLLFLTEEAAGTILSHRPTLKGLTVAFDEDCVICMKFARLSKRLDFFRTLTIDQARDPRSPVLRDLPYALRIDKLQALSETKLVDGFGAVVEVFRRLPLFMPCLPVLWLLLATGLGDKLYQRITRSSWRRSCQMGECAIVGKGI